MKLLAPAALLLLAGCAQPEPIVGGPCAYSSEEITTTVTGWDAEYVTIAEDGGNEFPIPASDFAKTPEIGDTIKVKKDTITSGTCTPVIFHVL